MAIKDKLLGSAAFAAIFMGGAPYAVLHAQQAGDSYMYCYAGAGASPLWLPCSPTTPLNITGSVTGSFSANLSPFTPTNPGARATPLSVLVSDSNTTLPAGSTAILVSNVGSNPAYCNVNGIAATTSDQYVPAGGIVEFGVPSGITALHCIATGGSTTANIVGGVGLGAMAGGGGGAAASAVSINGGTLNVLQTILNALPQGTNTLGAISAIINALPTGTNTIGSVNALVSGGTLNAVQSIVNALPGGTNTLGAISAIINALPTGANTIGTVNAIVTGGATAANQATEIANLGSIAANTAAAIPAGANLIGNSGGVFPAGATVVWGANTGTSLAVTATLAGTSGKTTYVCGYSNRANATAATTVTDSLTGLGGGVSTISAQFWVAPAASGLGIDEQIFVPCLPASAQNTGIVFNSGAPGAGGVVSAKIWGYQL